MRSAIFRDRDRLPARTAAPAPERHRGSTAKDPGSHPASRRSWQSGFRARRVFNPNTPDAEAGIRIEPPPSLACATGRMRAATAAPAPPEEPPDECARFQGFRVGPNSRDSVVGINPNSGLELLPKMVTPVLRKR